jgi:hypothetical protein
LPLIISEAAFFLLTLYKLKASITDEFGKVRYDVLKDRNYVSPLLVAFVKDGASNFLL